MYSKVIVVQIDSILKYPPTLALLQNLVDLNIETIFITATLASNELEVIPKEVTTVRVGDEYNYNANVAKKLVDLVQIRKKLWRLIDYYYNDNSIVWVMSNIALKHLGKKIYLYRYNIHLFELMDEVYYYKRLPFLRLDLKKICLKANKVITCEYNRAQITKTWFELPELPLIMVNKPVKNNIKKSAIITHSTVASNLIEKLKDKKIILYQGIVDKERPIHIFSKVIEELGNNYAFVVMTGSNITDLKTYKNTYIVPFVRPPFHLEVTSHAFVGLLLYSPVYDSFSSPLNSIYCAPNKLFEYSQFGIPMMGNDIPGLKYPIENSKMGCCFKKLEIDDIRSAILKVENNYDTFSENSLNYYRCNDNIRAIKEALS